MKQRGLSARIKWASAAALAVLPFVLVVQVALATNYSSSSFSVKDPVIESGGGSGTSATYEQLYTIGQVGAGQSTSAHYQLKAGFLYYPIFTGAPAVTATPGVLQVGLVWTAATGNVPVDHYEVGTGTLSGTETYATVGNVLAFTSTGLAAGTTYYFRVRAVDATGTVIITSPEVTATPTAPGGRYMASTVGAAAVPAAPQALFGQALDQHTIRWFFEDRANNESGFEVRDSANIVRAKTPPWLMENITSLDEFDLPANSSVGGRRVYATNSAGVSEPSEAYPPVFTLMETPQAPTATAPTASSVLLQAHSDGLADGFTNLGQGRSALLFQNLTTGEDSGWVVSEMFFFGNLTPGELYAFQVKARNGDMVEASPSPVVTFRMPLPNVSPPPATQPITLTVTFPAVDARLFSGTFDLVGVTAPAATVTIVINRVASTALADSTGAFRFHLRNLSPGSYRAIVRGLTSDGQPTMTVEVPFTVTGLPTTVLPPPLPPSIEPIVPPVAPPEIIPPPAVRSELPISPRSEPRSFILERMLSELETVRILALKFTRSVSQETAKIATSVRKLPVALKTIQLPPIPSPGPLIAQIQQGVSTSVIGLQSTANRTWRLVVRVEEFFHIYREIARVAVHKRFDDALVLIPSAGRQLVVMVRGLVEGGHLATRRTRLPPSVGEPMPRPSPTTVPSDIPFDIVVVKTTFGDLLLASGNQTAHAVVGAELTAFVRPAGRPQSVIGELVLKSATGEPLDIPPGFFFAPPPAGAADIRVGIFPYAPTEVSGVYRSRVTVPPISATYEFKTNVQYQEQTPSKELAIDLEAERLGYVYALTPRGQQERIVGAKVTLLMVSPRGGQSLPWSAAPYDQHNPVVTDITGEYTFLVPAGSYQLTVEHPDYETYISPAIILKASGPIVQPVVLRARVVASAWRPYVPYVTRAGGLAAALLVLMVAFRSWRRSRRLRIPQSDAHPELGQLGK